MVVKCKKCQMYYDDEFRTTICPHDTFLANDGNNNFAHHPESYISDEPKNDRLIEIANLVLSLGKVDRLTRHPDGTPEPVTTHTVMLGVICIYLNHALGLGMNSGLIAQLSLVHDLHEAICGDEITLWQDPEMLAKKRIQEAIAIEKVARLDIPGFQLYHSQIIKEARFVRATDKILPKLTHILNNALVLKCEGMFKEDFHRAIMERQYSDMETYVSDIPEVLALHRLYGQMVENLLHDKEGKK